MPLKDTHQPEDLIRSADINAMAAETNRLTIREAALTEDVTDLINAPATPAGFASTFADVSSLGSDPNQAQPANWLDKILLPTKNTDTGNNFNATAATVNGIEAYCYRTPSAGVYSITAKVRPLDRTLAADGNFGIGVDTVRADTPAFMWHQFTKTTQDAAPAPTNLSSRALFNYARVGFFPLGAMLRVFTYSTAVCTLSSANFTIIRIA